MNGQDFAIGFTAATATSHSFTDAAGTGLQPRVPKMLARLNLVSKGRGLVTLLKISGNNLLLTPGSGTTGNGTRAVGFPAEALSPDAMVDMANLLGVACGPSNPLELQLNYPTTQTCSGYIGTDDIPDELRSAVIAALAEGALFGTKNWGLGLGEIIQPTANSKETLTFEAKAPRSMMLNRIVAYGYTDTGAKIQPSGIVLTAFEIRGDPLLARSGNLDIGLLNGMATDEDGLDVGWRVSAEDLIKVSFDVLAQGAGVKGIVQLGFFTS